MRGNLKNYKLHNKLSRAPEAALNYLRNINGSLKLFNNKYLCSLDEGTQCSADVEASLAAAEKERDEDKSNELSNKCHAISDDLGTSI